MRRRKRRALTPRPSRNSSDCVRRANAAASTEEAMAQSISRLLPPVMVATTAVLISAAAAGQTSPPRLRLVPPADLYHSALGPPENYESTKINASLQVYAFR